jgi:hypothetical protein
VGLLGCGSLVLIILFDVDAENLSPVNGGHNVGAALLGLAGGEEHQGSRGGRGERAPEQYRIESQAKTPLMVDQGTKEPYVI